MTTNRLPITAAWVRIMRKHDALRAAKENAMKMCNCPAYPFPHRQGGGKCNLPDYCDFQEEHDCLELGYNDCPYQDECPIMLDMSLGGPGRFLVRTEPTRG